MMGCSLCLLLAVVVGVLRLVSPGPHSRNVFGVHFRHQHGRDPDPPLPITSDAGYRSRRHVRTPDCPYTCDLHLPNMHEIRSAFQDMLEEPDTRLVYFQIILPGYNKSVMEIYPYMARSFDATEWVWSSEHSGRKMLDLPLDADVLSLYIMGASKKSLDLHITTTPSNCLTMHSPECRLYAVRDLLIRNVTYVARHKHRRDFVCHRVVNDTGRSHSRFVYRCCDTIEFRTGNHMCQVYSSYGKEISGVLTCINLIAIIFTLFSPIVVMKIKIALKFDAVTKFFRASLKHGITGQRNYVIRISSRQLINLSDPKPFSLPRFLFRLCFHFYGEGRCCIHWWSEWGHQPNICQKTSLCRRCWLQFWRFFAVIFIYPILVYAAIALYAPRLQYYTSILDFTKDYLKDRKPLFLNVNLVAVAMIPTYCTGMSVWLFFSFIAFVYTVLLLSWPNNPLERCLLRYEGKRPFEQPNILYDRMTRGYKTILQRLAYGEFTTKRHFFHIPWIPWGIRRVFYFIGGLFMQIPIINIWVSMFMLDSNLFLARNKGKSEDHDEAHDSLKMQWPSCAVICKWFGSIMIWLGFVLVLAGYCTAVFAMTELSLNILFFTFLGTVLYSATVLPWICFLLVVIFYTNDTLSMINREHRQILQLIDENSPRISAVEDSEDVFRDGSIQILRTHNLGAVKFIDGDNTEYVSKELYYNVCTDLKCGWTRSLRRIFVRMSVIVLFVLFIFLSLASLSAFTGSAILLSLAAVVASLLPKAFQIYISARTHKSDTKLRIWAKIMPDILDRHIRVDRTQCLDEQEEELTTYDVRPVGLLEMDIPRMISARTLRLWKFPWVVSADQQTHSQENFIVALANKLAVASFLSKIVTRAYSPELEEEGVLRQWCLLVENCILEGSATASSINGVPVETIRLFPRDVQPLVSTFNTGETIDNVVDNINTELYGPFTKGVLVTIGNTSLALAKLDNIIFAFNSSCHGEQVTDLFGAVLVATEFNTQNLQTTIKYLVDPYSPDAVPVYSVVPTEGFVFKSPEILEIESPTETIPE